MITRRHFVRATSMVTASLMFGLAGRAAETNFPVMQTGMVQASSDISGQTFERQFAPKAFCLDGRGLQENRRKVLEDDPSLAKAAAKIRRDADDALRQKLVAVTDKTFAAPSGDKHDYFSLSPYFWPNPATANGLPYILRDGETNPEGKKYDSGRLGKMCHNIEVLALAYYLTGISHLS